MKKVIASLFVSCTALAVPHTHAQTNYEPYVFSTFVGNPPGCADGTGSAARFDFPGDLAVDSAGNVYVADIENDTIRKITPAGVVTTYAGLANSVGSADGALSVARFNRHRMSRPIAVTTFLLLRATTTLFERLLLRGW